MGGPAVERDMIDTVSAFGDALDAGDDLQTLAVNVLDVMNDRVRVDRVEVYSRRGSCELVRGVDAAESPRVREDRPMSVPPFLFERTLEGKIGDINVSASPGYFMSLKLYSRQDRLVVLALCRKDRPFDLKEVGLVRMLLPVMVAKTRVLVSITGNLPEKTAYFDKNMRFEGIILDDRLVPVDVPEQTLKALCCIFGTPAHLIPAPIMDWLRKEVAPEGKISGGVWNFEPAGKGLACVARVINSGRFVLLSFPKEPLADLSPREAEAAGYLPLGYTNAQIAKAMGLSESSVKKYITSAAAKLGAENRTELMYRTSAPAGGKS